MEKEKTLGSLERDIKFVNKQIVNGPRALMLYGLSVVACLTLLGCLGWIRVSGSVMLSILLNIGATICVGASIVVIDHILLYCKKKKLESEYVYRREASWDKIRH